MPTFRDAAQEHSTSIYYRGPFRTTRGDTDGTTLSQFLRHWPGHGRPQQFGGRFGSGAVVRVKVGSAFFFFASNRLVGVQLGNGDAADYGGLARPGG